MFSICFSLFLILKEKQETILEKFNKIFKKYCRPHLQKNFFSSGQGDGNKRFFYFGLNYMEKNSVNISGIHTYLQKLNENNLSYQLSPSKVKIIIKKFFLNTYN